MSGSLIVSTHTLPNGSLAYCLRDDSGRLVVAGLEDYAHALREAMFRGRIESDRLSARIGRRVLRDTIVERCVEAGIPPSTVYMDDEAARIAKVPQRVLLAAFDCDHGEERALRAADARFSRRSTIPMLPGEGF